MNRFDLQLFAVDTKTVKSADLAKVRDVDFTEQFVAGIQTLMTMLGVTRKLEKKAGQKVRSSPSLSTPPATPPSAKRP